MTAFAWPRGTGSGARRVRADHRARLPRRDCCARLPEWQDPERVQQVREQPRRAQHLRRHGDRWPGLPAAVTSAGRPAPIPVPRACSVSNQGGAGRQVGVLRAQPAVILDSGGPNGASCSFTWRVHVHRCLGVATTIFPGAIRTGSSAPNELRLGVPAGPDAAPALGTPRHAAQQPEHGAVGRRRHGDSVRLHEQPTYYEFEWVPDRQYPATAQVPSTWSTTTRRAGGSPTDASTAAGGGSRHNFAGTGAGRNAFGNSAFATSNGVQAP